MSDTKQRVWVSEDTTVDPYYYHERRECATIKQHDVEMKQRSVMEINRQPCPGCHPDGKGGAISNGEIKTRLMGADPDEDWGEIVGVNDD